MIMIAAFSWSAFAGEASPPDLACQWRRLDAEIAPAVDP
jgi:hypothetical protein